jgi:hypothetical protein
VTLAVADSSCRKFNAGALPGEDRARRAVQLAQDRVLAATLGAFLQSDQLIWI